MAYQETDRAIVQFQSPWNACGADGRGPRQSWPSEDETRRRLRGRRCGMGTPRRLTRGPGKAALPAAGSLDDARALAPRGARPVRARTGVLHPTNDHRRSVCQRGDPGEIGASPGHVERDFMGRARLHGHPEPVQSYLKHGGERTRVTKPSSSSGGHIVVRPAGRTWTVRRTSAAVAVHMRPGRHLAVTS